MSTAKQGREREYKVRDYLAERGWVPIMRAAASKGPGDLLMGHPDHGGALIQVGTASKTLNSEGRERFCYAAELIGALPLLCTVIPRPGKPTAYRFYVVTRDVPSKWPEWPTKLRAIKGEA